MKTSKISLFIGAALFSLTIGSMGTMGFGSWAGLHGNLSFTNNRIAKKLRLRRKDGPLRQGIHVQEVGALVRRSTDRLLRTLLDAGRSRDV